MREGDDGGLIIQNGYQSGVPLSLALLRQFHFTGLMMFLGPQGGETDNNNG